MLPLGLDPGGAVGVAVVPAPKDEAAVTRPGGVAKEKAEGGAMPGQIRPGVGAMLLPRFLSLKSLVGNSLMVSVRNLALTDLPIGL